MARRRRLAFAAVVLAASCGGGARGVDDSGAPLTPNFPPESSAHPAAAGAAATEGAVTAPGSVAPPAPTDPVAGGAAPPPVDAPAPASAPLVASLSDSAGDTTPSAPAPPPWADIVAARLSRSTEGFELRVTLGGGAAPTSSGGGDRTMNLASFYDVDGDGTIDYEVWANIASGGWGGSWFDDDTGHAAYVDDSGVAITVDGPEVVLRFPLSHLGGAERLRWSLATEYGTTVALGTDLTARDDAPDGDQPAQFPDEG